MSSQYCSDLCQKTDGQLDNKWHKNIIIIMIIIMIIIISVFLYVFLLGGSVA